jgi:hypothetical protein
MPIILATWESEIWRIEIKISPDKTLARLHLNRKNMVVPVIPAIVGSLK